MSDGLPIYASTNYQGDDTYEHIFTDRDGRMGQTILKQEICYLMIQTLPLG